MTTVVGCAHCEGGWILVEDETGRYNRPCDCRALAIRRARTRRMQRMMPERFTTVTLDRNPLLGLDEGVRTRLRNYIADLPRRLRDGRGLWLGGPVGTGKTSAAAVIAKGAADRGYTVGFHIVPDLLMRLQQSYGVHTEEERALFGSTLDLINELNDLDLLVLDDIASIHATPDAIKNLYMVVNTRWSNRRATIVTCDVPREELARRFSKQGQDGWRIVSRLWETCGRPVIIEGEDLRRRDWDLDVADAAGMIDEDAPDAATV